MMLPNRTRQSYSDLESVQIIIDKEICSIFPIDDFSTETTLNFCAIAKNSAVKTLRVTLLHLIDDQ